MAIDEPNFSTFGRPIQEDERVIFLKIFRLKKELALFAGFALRRF
jgi:hypothetical protein